MQKFEEILPITSGVANNSSGLPNISIFVTPISIFVSAVTTELEIVDNHWIDCV